MQNSRTKAELGKVLYQSVTDFKSTQMKIGKWIRNTQVGEAAIEGKKALFEDIKSGKFYNRERIDQLQVRSAGSLLSGWDDDDPFDNLESDFGGDWDDDSSDSDFDPLADIGNDDMFLADQMDNTGSKVTQGVQWQQLVVLNMWLAQLEKIPISLINIQR